MKIQVPKGPSRVLVLSILAFEVYFYEHEVDTWFSIGPQNVGRFFLLLIYKQRMSVQSLIILGGLFSKYYTNFSITKAVEVILWSMYAFFRKIKTLSKYLCYFCYTVIKSPFYGCFCPLCLQWAYFAHWRTYTSIWIMGHDSQKMLFRQGIQLLGNPMFSI